MSAEPDMVCGHSFLTHVLGDKRQYCMDKENRLELFIVMDLNPSAIASYLHSLQYI